MTTIVLSPPGRTRAGRVLAQLDRLTVTQRQVFVLHGATGLSLSETARRTGLARDAVRAIFAGAAQRLADLTATPAREVSGDCLTPAPEVFRRSPENPAEQEICAPTQDPGKCPAWCQWGNCEPDGSGTTYHMGADTEITKHTAVSLAQLDDPDVSVTVVSLHLGLGDDLSPAEAIALSETLRDLALTAAGPRGIEMPAGQAQIGEEILTEANGWQPVESLLVDGTAEHVAIYTSDGDDTGHNFATGDLVRVRSGMTS